jgi:indole-3-glycerol phosphate synthase
MRALPRVVLLLVLLAALLVPLVSLQLNMCAARRVDQMVKRKKIEVDNMLKRHQSKDDPLFMRMTYMAENQFHYAKSIKKPADGPEKLHTMSVVFDLKRRSPTIPENRNVVAYENPGQFAELLTYAGVDAFFVNVDETDYGGKNSDVADVVAGVRKAKPENPPPVILKDLVIHPIQIAQAAEWGCAGVVLMTCALGADLETLLDSCTIMGVEAIVEVHTPRELEFALGCGATTFFVNLWDRMSGKYYPDQVTSISLIFVRNICI